MNIGLTSKRIAVRDTTREVFIPGNPKAKLMYYLNCISVVLNTNKLSRYINYSQYYLIPDSEIPEIVALALLFSPEIMIKSRIFININYKNSLFKKYYSIQYHHRNFFLYLVKEEV